MPPADKNSWEIVLRAENKVVLYHSELNELKVEVQQQQQFQVEVEEEDSGDQDEDDDDDVEGEEEVGLEVISRNPFSNTTTTTTNSQELNYCSLCLQSLPRNGDEKRNGTRDRRFPIYKKDASYFTLLSQANSTVNSPRNTVPNSSSTSTQEEDISIEPSVLNTGYFESFFKVIQRLGRGGNGTVELVQHVLNGERLGLYACKKIAVGDSSPALLRILREVHLLESLQHPNVVSYHHAWIESSSLTLYGPPVPTLHILMGYANGGSLDDFILQRRGGVDSQTSSSEEGLSRAERIRIFRLKKFGAVHLLRLDEILDIFEDIVEGLRFLHNRNILHLDLKAGNVLLHWEDDALLPRAKLSDFGSSENTSESWQRERTGGSGTLDWTPPEAWDHDLKTGKLKPPDRSTDQWGLGLVLHLLCFFCLPYRNEDDTIALEEEIRSYPGFFPIDARSLDHGTRIPHDLLRLLSLLINRSRSKRPTCEEVLVAIRLIRAESFAPPTASSTSTQNTVVIKQRTPSPSPAGFNLLPPPKILRSSSFSSTSSSSNSTAIISELTVTTNLSSPKSSSHRASLPFIKIRMNNKNQVLFITILAILKAMSIQTLCRHSISPFTLYAILIPTLIDWIILDWRISILLAVIHLIGMKGMGGGFCT